VINLIHGEQNKMKMAGVDRSDAAAGDGARHSPRND